MISRMVPRDRVVSAVGLPRTGLRITELLARRGDWVRIGEIARAIYGTDDPEAIKAARFAIKRQRAAGAVIEFRRVLGPRGRGWAGVYRLANGGAA